MFHTENINTQRKTFLFSARVAKFLYNPSYSAFKFDINPTPESDLLTPAHIIGPVVIISLLYLHFSTSQVYNTHATLMKFALLSFSGLRLLAIFSIFIAFLLSFCCLIL